MLGRVKAVRKFGGKAGKALARSRASTGFRCEPRLFSCGGGTMQTRCRSGWLADRLKRPTVFRCRCVACGGLSRTDPGWFAGLAAPCTDHIGLNHEDGGAPNHQQRFDVVGADEHQATARINCRCIDHRQTRLASAGCCAETTCAETAHQPGRQPDQCQHNQKGNEKSGSQRHLRAEQRLEHQCAPFLVQRLMTEESPEWLMRPAQFAGLNTNRALTNKVAICGHRPVLALFTGYCPTVTSSAGTFLPAINHNPGKVCLVGNWERRPRLAMAIADIPILSMLCARLDWSQARQRVLAENVANSDTPRFRARDLAPLAFDE